MMATKARKTFTAEDVERTRSMVDEVLLKRLGPDGLALLKAGLPRMDNEPAVAVGGGNARRRKTVI